MLFVEGKAAKWFAEHFEEVLAAILLASMACLAMANVVTRYIIQLPLAFTEELEVNAMVLLTLLGSAVAFRKRRHLRLLFFIQKFSPLSRGCIERFISFLSAGLFCYLGYLGWMQLIDERFLEITSESLGYPQWIYTLAIPIGCSLVVLRILQAEYRSIRGRD